MKKKIIWFLGSSVVGSLIGYVLSNSYQFNVCVLHDVSCHQFFERTGAAMFYGSIALSIVFAVLLVIPVTFNAWKKFALFYIPIALLIFIFYPDPGAGDFLSPRPSGMFRYVSIIYVLLSLIVIGISYLKNYMQDKYLSQ